MLLFRSKEHLGRWIDAGHPRGAELTLDQQWLLAQRWFAGRHLPEWKKRSAEEVEAVFRSVGLEGDFWELS
jgi:hypothetical protein